MKRIVLFLIMPLYVCAIQETNEKKRLLPHEKVYQMILMVRRMSYAKIVGQKDFDGEPFEYFYKIINECMESNDLARLQSIGRQIYLLCKFERLFYNQRLMAIRSGKKIYITPPYRSEPFRSMRTCYDKHRRWVYTSGIRFTNEFHKMYIQSILALKKKSLH